MTSVVLNFNKLTTCQNSWNYCILIFTLDKLRSSVSDLVRNLDLVDAPKRRILKGRYESVECRKEHIAKRSHGKGKREDTLVDGSDSSRNEGNQKALTSVTPGSANPIGGGRARPVVR